MREFGGGAKRGREGGNKLSVHKKKFVPSQLSKILSSQKKIFSANFGLTKMC